MKRLLIATTALAIVFGSCKKKNDNNTTTTPTTGDSTVTLSGDITADRTLSADTVYYLNGFVYVMSGATIHIPAGTLIKGDKATKGTLVITRGGKIDAQGTAAKPIVFTSAQPKGARGPGDWGGVILLGKAPVNADGGEAKIEGGLVPTAGGDEKTYIYYGGTDASDNSGTIKYTRIEFAGVAYSPDNEINGLTFGGVGNGTTIDYVQCYRSGDDSYEWFGGTVRCTHMIATYSWDDDFDTDNGFSGAVQFGLANRIKTIADVSGSNGFESDNDANGSANMPKTSAVFANMSIVGPYTTSTSGTNANFQHAAQIRRNSSISIFNSILMGFPEGCYIDNSKGVKTIENVKAGTLKFHGNIIAGCTKPWTTGNLASAADSAAWTTFSTATDNQTLTNTTDVKLADPFKYSPNLVSSGGGVPSFLLSAGSPALTGGVSLTDYSYFTNTSYIGAFDGSNDWTAGWTNWNPEETDY